MEESVLEAEVEVDDNEDEDEMADRVFEIERKRKHDAFDASINNLDPVSDSTF